MTRPPPYWLLVKAIPRNSLILIASEVFEAVSVYLNNVLTSSLSAAHDHTGPLFVSSVAWARRVASAVDGEGAGATEAGDYQ